MAKKSINKAVVKTEINFEKELWAAANELRGAVSENNYKNYVLPLVFIKHLSERYEIVRDELGNMLNDPPRWCELVARTIVRATAN